jgi:hypothetical protein
VLRIVAFLLAFALMFNNGTTVALAMCQHADMQAHAQALASTDEQVASSALAEDAAERSVTHSKASSDGSTASVVAFVVPSDAQTLRATRSDPMRELLFDERAPPSSSIPPLLRPPLG